MIRTAIVIMILTVFGTFDGSASEAEFLGWTSAAIQCGRTAEAGDIACEIKIGEKGWEKFSIQAFGKTHLLTEADLAKLNGFPLSSLHTTHEAGYERLGGYTVSFRFDRTFYNSEKKVVTEIIYVSVTNRGLTVSDRRTKEN